MAAAPTLENHPDRIALANELHARPFAMLRAPFRLSHVAFASPPSEADKGRAHLKALCERFGATPPAAGAPHMLSDFGRFRLKWERHTEFIAMSVIAGPAGPEAGPFQQPAITLLPDDWMARAPGPVLAAAHLHAEAAEGPLAAPADSAVPERYRPHFVRESLLGGSVFDDRARFWGDFRIHEDGFMRFALLADPDLDEALFGRLVQRLIEIETYRAAAMLALPAARGLWPRLNAIDEALAESTAHIGETGGEGERAVLDRITALSAEIEAATASNAFRLDAARAYSAIVWRRIGVLDAKPLPGLLNLNGFMLRRFEPAMKSCEATAERLNALSRRASRAATLLRTRIDVALEEQNRELLASMDARSATQLRLQETVEGFSVVALSYYAVSLAALAVAPLAKGAGLSESWTKALLVPPMVLLVWLFIRRVKRRALGESG